MANYTGHLLEDAHQLFAVTPEHQARTPWLGWDRDWDEIWGRYIFPSSGWNLAWNENWGGVESGIWRPMDEAFHREEQGDYSNGTQTVHGPIFMPSANFTAHHAGGHADVFYNRILIEPVFIDFGSILGTQQVDISIFNGFLYTVQLDALTEVDFDTGLSVISEAMPAEYLPLEEQTYTVEATLAGPPQTDASLVFDWETGIDDITVYIVGTRIVLLPVTFRSNVRETLMWKTDVLNSYNGTEQRVKMRLKPRQRLAISAYLGANERFRVENLIYGWRKRIWAIPMWIEARRADAPVNQDDTVISVDTRWGDFRADYLAVIWESPRKFDVFQIDTFDDVSITMTRGANEDFADPIIMPVRSARMLKDPVRKTTGYDAILETLLEVTDNISNPAAASAIQYNGEDTFFMEPLQLSKDGSPDSYQHRIDLMDAESGVTEQFAPWTHIRIQRQFELILEGLQEIWEMRQWLHRRAGRLVPFYMPTYENNLRLLTEGTIADSIEVVEDDYSTQSLGRTTIMFKMKDGTYIFKTILDAIINPSGNTEITLDSSVLENAEDVDEISFIGLKRLTSDQIDIDWMANNVAAVTVPITELEP